MKSFNLSIFQSFNRNKGFTLIEMLTVIAIIAILSSIFLVGFTQFRKTAYDSRRISDLQKVQSYLELYIKDNRKYPDVTAWTGTSPTLESALSLYVSKLPTDPLPGETYVYCYYNNPGTLKHRQSYILSAKLSDNKHAALNDSYKTANESLAELTAENYTCPSTGFTGCRGTDKRNYCTKL